MRIDIQSNHIELKEDFVEQIKAKVAKLEHFYENIVDAIVYLREENTTVKEVEIKLIVKDHTLFVKENGAAFPEAFDLALEAMKRQIKKYKEKHIA